MDTPTPEEMAILQRWRTRAARAWADMSPEMRAQYRQIVEDKPEMIFEAGWISAMVHFWKDPNG